MTNRNGIKQWFMTYPQSTGVTKSDFLDCCKTFVDIKYYKVVQETHEDGSPHLHALYILNVPVTKSNLLRFIREKFPSSYMRIDVKPVRSLRASHAYLDKEDSSPLETPGGLPRRQPLISRTEIDKFFTDYGGLDGYEREKEIIQQFERELLGRYIEVCNYIITYSGKEFFDHFSSDLKLDKKFYNVKKFFSKNRENSNDITKFIEDIEKWYHYYAKGGRMVITPP